MESWNPFFFVSGNTKRDRFLKVDSQELVANNVESHKDRHRGGLLAFRNRSEHDAWQLVFNMSLRIVGES